MNRGTSFRVGSRGSDLALWQAEFVRRKLAETDPLLPVEIVIIETKGDRVTDRPLAEVGGAGLFIKELERALIEDRVDCAVHSAKDVPSEVASGTRLTAFTAREDPRDALVAREARELSELPPGAVLATGSLRRRSLALARRPDLTVEDLRGNLPTRLEKFRTSQWDAIILACAGLKRLEHLNLADATANPIPIETMLPAVGQGALALQAREEDSFVQERLAHLDDPDTARAVRAERSFLKRLQGGCQVPIAAHGRMKDGKLHLDGFVGTIDGRTTLSAELSGNIDAGEELGLALAEKLLERGAGRILEQTVEPKGGLSP